MGLVRKENMDFPLAVAEINEAMNRSKYAWGNQGQEFYSSNIFEGYQENTLIGHEHREENMVSLLEVLAGLERMKPGTTRLEVMEQLVDRVYLPMPEAKWVSGLPILVNKSVFNRENPIVPNSDYLNDLESFANNPQALTDMFVNKPYRLVQTDGVSVKTILDDRIDQTAQTDPGNLLELVRLRKRLVSMAKSLVEDYIRRKERQLQNNTPNKLSIFDKVKSFLSLEEKKQ